MANLAASEPPGKPESDLTSLLGPPRAPGASRGLAEEIAGRIAERIRGGQLAPGARLPTEAELAAGAGVSRAVVREAVAALRAEGLVVTRQGSGAFVAAEPAAPPFRIDPAGLNSLQDVVDVMELRLAVEVGSAGLAAERGRRGDLAAIRRALARMDEAVAADQPAIDQDFDFHRAIAAASGNPQFVRILELLGRIVIPRQSVRGVERTAGEQRRYLETVQAEHARILEAIEAHDPAAARLAMRTHLSRGLARYRALASSTGRANRKEQP